MRTLSQIESDLLARGCTVAGLDPGDDGYAAAVAAWAAEVHAAESAVEVPSPVTRRQLFLVLAGLPQPITRAALRAMLEGNEPALIEFDEALSFAREHPLIASLAGQLGLSDADVDDLFRAASQL